MILVSIYIKKIIFRNILSNLKFLFKTNELFKKKYIFKEKISHHFFLFNKIFIFYQK